MSSALGPGSPNRWRQPHRPDGSRDLGVRDIPHTRMAGSHVGNYSGMNLLDPQPGKAYQWVSLIGVDGNISDRGENIVMAQARGWRVVRRTDHGVKAAVDSADIPNAPRGQSETEGEVIKFGTQILMEIDEWRLGELRQSEFDYARKRVTGAASAYINGATPQEQALGMGGPSRFARKEHHGVIQENGEVVETIYDPNLPRD